MSAIDARSWDDLDSGEHEIYGREREEKLPIRLFFVQKEKWADHDAFHVFWLYAYKDYPRYKSNRLFPFYYQLSSKIDNRYLFLSPLYSRETDGSEQSQSLLWLYYWGNSAESVKNYKTLLPVFTCNATAESSFFLSPLYAHSLTAGTRFRSILWLLYWGSNDATDSGYSALLPAYYYAAQGDDNRLIITPLFFYYRRGAQAYRRTTFGLPILPILWISDAPQESRFLLFPLYYSSTTAEGTTRVSPIYYDIKSEHSHFQMLIPLYLDYDKRNYSFHLNITGVSLSEEKTNALPLMPQINSEQVIIDWDLGWFYNLFRVSSRSTIDLKESPPAADAITPPAPADAADPQLPQVTHKRERTRAASTSFFGTYFLFGLSAYERADHYRHFRLLPLSWLTWNTLSDSGVQTIIPVYVHYKDDTMQYLVLFPVYGIQQKQAGDCTTEISAWLLIGYWNEFDCATKTSEQTVLWPLINRYRAPDHGGFRIFPFFWKKWQMVGEQETQTHFSPVHYTTVAGENFSTISWLFYKSRTDSENTFGVWGLFHIMRSQDGLDKTTYVLPFYLSQTEYDVAKAAGTSQTTTDQRRRETLFTFAALLWVYRDLRPNDESFSMQISLIHLSFTENNRSHFYSWLFYASQTPSASNQGVPLLFNRRVYRDASYENIYIFPYYHSREKLSYAGGGDETVTWLFPLYYDRSTENSKNRFLLWYYYERQPNYRYDLIPLIAGRTDDQAGKRYSWHALLHTIWHKHDQQEVNFRLLYGLLFQYSDSLNAFSWHIALVAGSKSYTQENARHHRLLPLWWYTREGTDTTLYLPFVLTMFENRSEGRRLFRAVLLGILYYQNTDLDNYDQTLGVMLGALYYHNKYPERHFDSYGSLYGLLWHYETEDNYKRFSALTFIYIRTETEKGVRHRVLGIPL